MITIVYWFGSVLLAICGLSALWAAGVASLDRLGAVVAALRLWADSGADKPDDASIAEITNASRKERALWLLASILIGFAMIAFASTALTARAIIHERGWQAAALLIEAILASMSLFWVLLVVATPGLTQMPAMPAIKYNISAEAQTRGMPRSITACVAPEIDRLVQQIAARQAQKPKSGQAASRPN